MPLAERGRCLGRGCFWNRPNEDEGGRSEASEASEAEELPKVEEKAFVEEFGGVERYI